MPPLLQSFIGMLLEGTGNENTHNCEAALSISQLTVFNTTKRRRQQTSDDEVMGIKHNTARETPLPIYLGLMLHCGTRQKKYVGKCHKLGLSISYERVLQLVNKTTNAICDKCKTDDIVCPPTLRSGLFIVAAADKIDHNLSSTSASSSFHGTGLRAGSKQ